MKKMNEKLTGKGCISGKRYLFHELRPHMNDDDTISYETILFRANFVAILGKTLKTLIVNSAEMESNKTTQVSIPLEWITKIETLENILCNYGNHDNLVLHTDVLLMIDDYL